MDPWNSLYEYEYGYPEDYGKTDAQIEERDKNNGTV